MSKNSRPPVITAAPAAPKVVAPAPPSKVFPQGVASISVSWVRTEAVRKRRLNTDLSGRQGRALRALFDGLQFEGATLSNGREIINQDQALKFVLERFADSIGIE